jgi:hypothetical protein
MYGQQETFTYVRATSLAKHDAHWNAPNAFRQANAARRSASLVRRRCRICTRL